jgi:hypothetical protein
MASLSIGVATAVKWRKDDNGSMKGVSISVSAKIWRKWRKYQAKWAAA